MYLNSFRVGVSVIQGSAWRAPLLCFSSHSASDNIHPFFNFHSQAKGGIILAPL